MKSFRASGQVVDCKTRRGIPGLRVEAWDKEWLCPDLVDCAVTDEQGTFQMALNEAYLRQLFLNGHPVLFFKVFQGDTLVANTENSVLWRVRALETEVCIPVDLAATPGAERPAPSVVRVRVLHAADGPLAGQTVRAFDKNVGVEEKVLGQAMIDRAGRCEIRYTIEQLGRPGKHKADLSVRVFDARGAQLAQSDLICQAPPTATIDLVVDGKAFRGPSECETLMAWLSPALNGVEPERLTDEEVGFVACSTGLDSRRLALLVSAHSLAKETGVEPEVWYALIRGGLPTSRRALLSRSPQSLRRALESSLRNNVIRAQVGESLDSVMEQLQQATVQLAFEAPDPGATTSLGDLLGIVMPTRETRQEFLTAYLQHDGRPIEAFWQELAERPAFRNGIVEKLQLTLQLDALTRHHLPLVRKLQQLRRDGTAPILRDLAQFDETGWLALINGKVDGQPIGPAPDIPGEDGAARARNYAAALYRTVETTFPTAVLAHRIGRDPELGNADFTRFFANNPGFEFGKTRVAAYLADNPQAMSGVADPAMLTLRLKGMERLFKLTPYPSEVQVLMADGWGSAQSVVRMGKSALKKQSGRKLGSDMRVEAIHNSACWVTAASHALASKYHAAFNTLSAYVLPHLAPQDAGPQIADWQTLFGSLDFCTCEHCLSVYSPAAYLVDLLQFLDRYDSKALKPKGRGKFNIYTSKIVVSGATFWSARDILLDRRPDIAHIELSCENTNTLVPYVDLVNEILEYAVANIVLSLDISFPDHIATTGTASELSANPQPIKERAYNTAS